MFPSSHIPLDLPLRLHHPLTPFVMYAFPTQPALNPFTPSSLLPLTGKMVKAAKAPKTDVVTRYVAWIRATRGGRERDGGGWGS